MSDRSNALIALLAGLAAGAALGILLAPQSGKETRSQLKKKGREARDRFDELLDEGHEKWSEAKGKASDAASMTRDEVDDFVRFLFKEGRDLWDRVKADSSTTGQREKDKSGRTGH